MPYKFEFYVNGALHFHALMHSRQCQGRCKNGQRCARRVIIGYEYCFQHLKTEKHLTIKPSTLPNAGLGLFAWAPGNSNEIVFHRDETICRYNGEIIDAEELDDRYTANGTAPYAIREGPDRINDAATERTVGSLANTRPGHQNASISISNGPTHICKLRASRNIRAGAEIFLAYGHSYHINQPGYSYRTLKHA